MCVPVKDLYVGFLLLQFPHLSFIWFGKEEVDVYRFMSKQFIALFAGLLVLCSYPVYFSPKNAWSYFEKKNWYRFCQSFHISCTFSFRTAHGNRRTWDFTFVQCLFCKNSPALRADFFLHQCPKDRLLFWCYSPCSEDSEKDSCSNKIKTTCYNWSLLFAAHQCRHWKRHSRLMKQIISSLQFFSMFSHL